jgi:type IV pilus assembly protein PilB
MAATNMNLTGIARKLVLDKHLDEAAAVEAVENANKESIQLTSYLVQNKIVPSNIIAMISSQEFGLPVFDLKVMDLEMAAFSLVEEKLITKLNAIPLFKRGNKLYIAISSPTNTQALDEFKFATGLSTEAVLVQEDQLIEFIDKAVSSMDSGMEGMGDMLDDDLEDLDMSNTLTRFCSMRLTRAPRIFTSSPTKSATVYVTASTAYFPKSPRHRLR